METIYNAEYFYRKFWSIPEEMWLVGQFFERSSGRACALGQCGERDGKIPDECWELRRVLAPASVSCINDKVDPRYQQPTPRLRILAALADIIKAEGKQVPNMEPEVKPERVVYVTVDSEVRDLQKKELTLN